MRALGHGQQRVHTQLFHGGLFKDQALEAKGFGQFLGLIGQVGRRADVARQIAQIAR